ncbi:GNAT family N-acetyltransferase [Roseovarius sp. LXJ103]|uniref:GNAT family N-acetyltransferase n=1 Tax=Roseovarius carneus TaxID=2853164 RepID=UPI000D61EE9F|nr:GNAT family N-acetyltransferase [Roseovarius carneus]MBZ8119478.1 GNAT family N-acetyltransferase [Roseovarius carneus]PWE34891.1 hypothetical protein DD563_02185 [Pelagicola sp. LXJ1103]
MDIRWTTPDVSPALPGTPMQQHPTYARSLAAFGRESVVAEIYDRGTRIARAQIALREFGPIRLAWLARGPVWAGAIRANCLTEIKRTAPWRRVWAASTDDNKSRGLRISHPVQMAEIDLRPDATTRRAALHGKWRNRLCHAEGAGLTLIARPCCLPRDGPLLMREVAQRKARGYAGLPPDFTAAWIAADPSGTLLIEARQGGEVLAFMLFLRHADRATYHAGWTGALGRALSAHNLTLWHGCEALAQSGVTGVDLGRMDSAPPGLARFKRGAGADIVTLTATHLSV